MNKAQINKDLELLGLKNKVLLTLKYYLFNTSQMELSCFYRILDLLKQKYDVDTNDFSFIEGIRCNLQNYSNNLKLAISNMSSYIFSCKNEYLLRDLLKSIDTGINYQLTNHQAAMITAETGNDDVCVEDIKSIGKHLNI